ncbi:MAG: type II toxin-antitoxin system ParD family antitoxin [Chromatiales bacterium]|nr:type II toxin-antitoxin system ParD family antitoxin [Gammaproteobacteria bacterium]MBW6477522.1 type II toxin-antitoxin system ParD family antitoxin [Chromatiales bacterium]
MATMNVSLPDTMKTWVEEQAHSGKYSNTSDYIRDLIRHDQLRAEKIARMQFVLDEGLASGEGTSSMDRLLELALERVKQA